MAIEPTKSSGGILPTTVREARDTPAPAASKKTEGRAQAASASFQSSRAVDTSQDIDAARVAELREAIGKGELAVDTSRIADAIIESAREMAGPTQGR